MRRAISNRIDPREEIMATIKHYMSTERLAEASLAPDKKKLDAYAHVIRDAVSSASLICLSGVPHVYCRQEGKYISFDFHEFKSSIDALLRKVGLPDGFYSKTGKLVGDCWSEVMCHKHSVDKSIVVMNNGVYNTIDGCLHPFDSKYITNMKVNYDYNETEMAVGWKRFLSQVIPNTELQMMLQEFIASSFIDRSVVKFEHMLILLGSGSNGKSVVFEVVNELLGQDNVSNFSIRDLITSGKCEQNIAFCNGMRMNYCSEIKTTEINERVADSFKTLVSGEAMMARSLYKEPFKATNIPIIMANANKLPKLEEVSYSIERRILIIPFDVRIPEELQNRELAAELLLEMSGIFNWVMEGYKRLSANHFKIFIPDIARRVIADYMKSNNPILRWLDECGYYANWKPNVMSTSKWISANELYTQYNEWCEKNESGYMKKNSFSIALEGFGYDRRRKADGWGFLMYRMPSEDEIRSARLDAEIAEEQLQYLKIIRTNAKKKERPTIVGSTALDRYLGLEKDTTYTYLNGHHLEGTYRVLANGELEFDVKAVQAALSMAGYYDAILNGKNAKRNSAYRMKAIRHSFNSSMKSQGLPFRKYKANAAIPVDDIGCIVVPDDWEYSKRAGELFMMDLQKRKNSLENGIG